MKTTKQKKGKIVEAPKKHNVVVGCTGVRKSTNRTGGRRQSIAGVLPFSAAQVVGQQIPRRETTEVPKLEPKIGLHPSEKIKLQLFPIDDVTKIGLEKDGHNPFLELTLRARKKISSVLKHLNGKWGSSSVALGELVLFPYNIQLEKLNTYKRWSLNDSGTSAGDVHAAIESPVVFRLRYGWFSNLEPKTVAIPSRSTPLAACFESQGLQKINSTISELMNDTKEKLGVTNEDFKPFNTSKAADAVLTKNMSGEVAVDCTNDEVKIGNGLAQSVVPWVDSLTDLSIGGLLSEASLQGKISNCDPKSKGSKLNLQPIQIFSSDISIGGLLSEASLQGMINNQEPKSNASKLGLPTMEEGLFQSSVPWDDCLTTLSIGGLLSEASLQGKIDGSDPKSNGSKLELQPSPLISDSLDAFIAGRLNSQPQASKPSLHVSHSSILDAEETCHAFPVRKFYSSGKDGVPLGGTATSGDRNHDGSLKSFKLSNFAAELNGQGELAQDPRQESKTGLLTNLRVNNDESSLGLAGIKWTESLEPFDVGLSNLRQITSGDSVSISEFGR